MKKGITAINKKTGDMLDYPTAEAAGRATGHTTKLVQDIAAGRAKPLVDYDYRFSQGISRAHLAGIYLR